MIVVIEKSSRKLHVQEIFDFSGFSLKDLNYKMGLQYEF
jgi:diketogulonate reductase-like aldo/keto reductase